MELINSSKNKLNSKINWLFNLEPNTLILEIFRGERERERERERVREMEKKLIQNLKEKKWKA